jgi:hypothetical protein
MKLTVLALTFATAATAYADPSSVTTRVNSAPSFSLGVRVGGYGFRREGDTSASSWTECRMNGLGVFGNHRLRGPFFVEGGLDVYTSQNFPTPANPNDLPIDRSSGLLSAALGARTPFTSWLGGYVQLGAGLELTHVSVPWGDDKIRDNKLMPEGFFGFGADIKLGKATYIGAQLRTLLMGNFDYDPAQLEMQKWTFKPSPDQVFDASPSLAAQGQFYLRHDL